MNPLKQTLSKWSAVAGRHIIVIFVVFLAAIYGLLAFRAVSLEQVEPDQTTVSANLKTASIPHVDQQVVNKMKQLQDNSMVVRTIFDQARNNPFDE